MRKVEILAVGEACKAIYSGLHQTGKGNRAFDSSGFFRRGDFFFFFASAVPQGGFAQSVSFRCRSWIRISLAQ